MIKKYKINRTTWMIFAFLLVFCIGATGIVIGISMGKCWPGIIAILGGSLIGNLIT